MAGVDCFLNAPDGSSQLSFKADSVQMDVTRTPIITEIAANTMVFVDIGKVRRTIQLSGLITTDATLGAAKAQAEAMEAACLNWWNLAGGNGAFLGGPAGTVGKARLIIGTKSDNVTNKTYFVSITRVMVLDSPDRFNSTQQVFQYTMTCVEAGDAGNVLSASG